MAAAVLVNVKHSRPSQIADEPPDGAMGQGKLVGDLSDRALGMRGDVEQDGAMAGDEIEASDKAPSFRLYGRITPVTPSA